MAGRLTFRELPGEEWSRLTMPPFSEHGLPPDNGHWRILVAEVDGEIVACTSVHTQVHWDPWWIAESHRTAGVVRGLIRQGFELLTNLSIDHAFCTIGEDDLLTQDQAERLGFVAAPGKLYLIDIPELTLED